ncbi:hypothetical protein CERZMDRAFT_37888 [Cercospora zeae-maydis SCOH1-5]|uniref:Uncharacterized protein n=1 Tax=Cercospora zeae-maydis SCOH1-5 TaxID=717836 RepID=A0A6A6FL89_9PEZI|nr:hypothetical protein CERZMDRAFT_37888 [Cercospora zeae-maydis SCOH1-5]
MDYVRRNESDIWEGFEGTYVRQLCSQRSYAYSVVSFDVFHSLHCLNQLRKRLSPEYYPPSHLHGRVHDMHCIDHLRQVLQCSSVASIIPSLYRPTIGMQYSDAGQPHVCRNFEAIHNYTRERFTVKGHGLSEWRDIVY